MKPTNKARLQLHETSDYAKFLFNQVQRVDDRLDKHIQNIAISMQTWGFLPSKPIHTVNENGKLRIIDGHNRFAAAKHAKIPVIYQIGEAREKAAMVDINHNTKKWTNRDYINSYAMKGNPNYITLLKYIKAGLPVIPAASLLFGQAANSGNLKDKIPRGEFIVKTTEEVDALLSVFAKAPEVCTEIRSMNYIMAVSALTPLSAFDLDVFLEKLTKNPLALTKAANRKQALETIQDIYNYQSRNKVPLAFLAEQRLAERNAAKPRTDCAAGEGGEA